MTVDEASQVLGLGAGATAEQVESAWKRLRVELHPDRNGGDEAGFRRAQEAYETLKQTSAGASQQLVPLNVVADLVRASTGHLAAREERRERREDSQKLVNAVVRVHTGRLRRLRDTSAIATAVAAAVAGAARFAREDESAPLVDVIPVGSLTVIAVILGVVVALLGLSVRFAEQRLAHATEVLDDRPLLVDAIYEIEETSEIDLPWTRNDLAKAIRRWMASPDEGRPPRTVLQRYRAVFLGEWARVDTLRDLAARVGRADFTRLFIAKSLEHGTIEQRDVREGGRLVVYFDLVGEPE